MAHQLEQTSDGRTSFAYSKQHGSPWHQLGVALDGLSDLQEIMAACRANYTVRKLKIFVDDPAGLDGGNVIKLDTGMSYTWRERPIWIDPETGNLNGGDRHVLGVVGNDYTVIQNEQVGELAARILGHCPGDPIIDCGGVLDDGRRFFLTIPLPDIVIDVDGVGDRHVRNLVVTTGHDGTHSVQFVKSIVRAVCANTVQAALRESKWRVTIRHTGRFDPDTVDLRAALGLIYESGDEFARLAERLLAMPATFDDVVTVHDKIWTPEDPGASDRAKGIRMRRVDTLESLWSAPTNVGAVGPNRWAALNTFSEYFQHRQSFAGSKVAGARDLRATQIGGLHSKVNQATQMLVSM